MNEKEKPTTDMVGGNGKESDINIAQNDIENRLDCNFNKNDYLKLIEIIRQETMEAFRNKYIRILAEKLGLGFGDVARDVKEQKQQQ